jgi:hypothetical protein
MPGCLLAHLAVRQNDILHVIVTLEKIYGALEEGRGE